MDKSNFPLVYYRMPHEKDVWFLQSEQGTTEIDPLNSVPPKTGFILYPFTLDSSSNPYFIEADNLVRMSPEDMLKSDKICESVALPATWDISTDKDEYCKNVASAIAAIRAGVLQKVVLSRTKKIKTGDSLNPLKIFHKLCMKYPAAFVSLVYIPRKALWLTATPELLVSANQNNIKTVSLAGTKPTDSEEEWGDKEKLEQQLVTDYINEILEKYCKDIAISGPGEVVAGNVKHLETSFSATLKTNLWNVVSALHPTPAVCGIPLVQAKQFITETEGYDRKYYTGFIGPCNMDGKTDLFVNLRCAGLFANGINLYIGGGITKDSIPEKEWEETELKSKTLLFAFEENEKNEENK